MHRIGVDIGGTKIQVVAVDSSGAIVAQTRLPTGFGAAEVIDSAVRGITTVLDELGIGSPDGTTIGVGVPGMVNRVNGRVSHALNLGVDELDLRGELTARLGMPVEVENDVKAAALGVYQRLVPDARSLAYINLGTGIAAGLVLGGRLWRGEGDLAGEIGHIPVERDGYPCACGQLGCLEAVASGAAIARQWPAGGQNGIVPLLAAAASGDSKATAIARSLGDNLAYAIQLLVLALDLEVIVLGGGLVEAGAPLLSTIEGGLRRAAGQSPFIAGLRLESRIRMLPNEGSIAAMGAALLSPAGQDESAIGHPRPEERAPAG